MILVIDIGNTLVKIGLFKNDKTASCNERNSAVKGLSSIKSVGKTPFSTAAV